MIPVGFSYERPTSVDGALALLAEHGEDATVLAGGHSLLPVMKLRLAAPELVIDIGGWAS
jgi:carbon-monoxide dehydrogenase medium subunit